MFVWLVVVSAGVEAAEAAAAVITVQSAVSRHHPAQLAPVNTGIVHTGALASHSRLSVACRLQGYCTQEHQQCGVMVV